MVDKIRGVTWSDWWDNYEEEPRRKEESRSMEIECSEDMKNPIGFIRLRERHRVKAVGIRRPAR